MAVSADGAARPPEALGVTGLLVAGVIWWSVQVSPLSVEVATLSGCDRPGTPREGRVADVGVPEEGAGLGVVRPHLLLVGEQAEFCLLTITGACQLAWLATVAAVSPVDAGPSIRDTAIASKPLETLLAGEVGGEAGIVQPGPVRPREPDRCDTPAERHRGGRCRPGLPK